MKKEQENQTETQTPANDPAVDAPEGGSDEGGEFKLTVRKLEMPVRPRGVLAE